MRDSVRSSCRKTGCNLDFLLKKSPISVRARLQSINCKNELVNIDQMIYSVEELVETGKNKFSNDGSCYLFVSWIYTEEIPKEPRESYINVSKIAKMLE
ncbi:hypothetical protein AYI70_g1764 [Smittium culicis]|uniref:Uncharacterized protein n=1 Tax=Smittium culicis TaxID=133412 RepID=A0A1R1YB75_9FUNG|nr:hypothetical protein AYI70_g1764 [Smittium culicis]